MTIEDYLEIVDFATESIDDVIEKLDDDERVGAFCRTVQDLSEYTSWLLGYHEALNTLGIICQDNVYEFNEYKSKCDDMAIALLTVMKELSII